MPTLETIPVETFVLIALAFVGGGLSKGIVGIGLPLVGELMLLMGGKLVIAEASGGGADMQLRFRLAAAWP